MSLNLKAISLKFANRPDYVIRELSHNFPGSSTSFVVGKNGSGKSTLLNILASIYRMSSGSITFNGQDIYSDLERFRRETVLIESGFRGFYPRLSGLDNLMFFNFLKGGKSSSRDIVRIADKVGLDQNTLRKKYHTYSLGTQQKMHLAKMFFGENKLVLMDEPTTGLDDASKAILSALIMDELKNTTTIIASHDVEFIRSVPAQILNLQDGKFD